MKKVSVSSARRLLLSLELSPKETHPPYYSETKEQIRRAINHHIRHRGEFDEVIDFERALDDRDNPRYLNAKYDKGDHLHPNGAGYRAMAGAIDLTIFSHR
ncbi:hypothetical protein PSAC2689_70389 [Paraburkholderia sacchari]